VLLGLAHPADALEQSPRLGLDLLLRTALDDDRALGDVPQHAEVREEVVRLEDHRALGPQPAQCPLAGPGPVVDAHVTDPPILFMDEPFSSLDPLLRRELQNEFVGLRERLRKTIVFITHEFDEAIRLADRIAIMRDGKILEIGTPEDLIIHSRHPYVREFTKHADRKNVIRARTLARPADPAQRPGIMVDGGQLVSEIASEVMSARSPVGVAEGGRLLGLIAPSDVLSILKGDEFRREGSH